MRPEGVPEGGAHRIVTAERHRQGSDRVGLASEARSTDWILVEPVLNGANASVCNFRGF
jgi:hypothetical protein